MGSGSSRLVNDNGTVFNKPSFNAIGTDIATTPYNLRNIFPGSKKYALFIGCNYIDTTFSLGGCINDVYSVSNFFENWNYDEIIMMTDYSIGNLYPTKVNIINKITEYVDKLTANDTLVIYYSGHGSFTRDTSGDEISGYDSVLVPLDVRSQGYILDDTLRSIFSNAVAGSNIFAVFDSCNSGSVCDLRYNYYDTSYRQSPFVKIIPDLNPTLIPRYNTALNNKYEETAANIISLSGCKDNEFSYEMVTVNGNIGGGLTYSLIKCIKQQTPDITFEALLSNIKGSLLSLKLNQNPSLMSGKQFSPETLKLNDYIKV
jgi:hypothetical protein